ncbi:MAG: hypothetical protein M1368_07065 [Thaumarchaeota archaeon]|nr:hypothetical protein [Nitrososphaerota archaeon]
MLTFSRFSFDVTFHAGASLPYWMGSTFRGGLGQHLSHSVCLGQDCPYCKSANCLFADVYTPRPEKRGHAHPPKPVIIIPPFFGRSVQLKPGGQLSLEAVMLGDYVQAFLQLVLGMISLGEEGVGPDRHYGKNCFEVTSVKCLESGGYVFKDSRIDSSKFATRDIKDLEPLCDKDGKEVVLRFRTPFTGPFLPRTTGDVIQLIRNRLILLVNEYGSGETVPSVHEKTDDEGVQIELKEIHRHILLRKSSRSQKDRFLGWTGLLSIKDISKLSMETRRLLACGSILGMGPDSSFGSGFMELLQPALPKVSPKAAENLPAREIE